MMPRYIPLPRAARALTTSRGRVIALIHAGALRAKLCAGRWWVESESLAALLRARRHGPGRAA